MSERSLIPIRTIERVILNLRGHNVMLDADLAAMYRVETKDLVRAVRRNPERFRVDFLFQLSRKEFEGLRRHVGTSRSWGGRRYRPYAFTEQGVAMLSSVLRSPRAVRLVENPSDRIQVGRALSDPEPAASESECAPTPPC